MADGDIVQGLLFFPHKKKVEDMMSFQWRAVHESPGEGYLLLPAAFRNSYPQIVQGFLKCGAKILTSSRNYPDLREAVEAKSVEVAEIIVDCKFLKKDKSPKLLRLYTDGKNVLTIKKALSHTYYFNVYAESPNSKRNFKWTTDADSVVVLEKFLASADVYLRHGEEGMILHLAASRNDEPLSSLLLRKGANIDARTNQEKTPLSIAADLGHVEMVTLFLRHGASVNAEEKNGSTPLHAAAWKGHHQVCEILLEHGASVSAVISAASVLKGATPLHLAIDGGHTEVVELLLKNGADMRVVGNFSRSSLQIAVEKGHARIVDIVLNHGADITDLKHRAAFLAAVRSNSGDGKLIVERMLQSGFSLSVEDARDSRLLHGAVRQSCLPVVERLLELGANVNGLSSANYSRKIPLHVAAEYACDDVVSLLLQKGADVNAKCHMGRTPLFYFAQAGRFKFAEALIKSGASVKIQDNGFETALSCTCVRDLPEMAELLLKNGADVNEKAPIVSATKQGFLKVVEVLCRFGAQVNIKLALNRTLIHEASARGFSAVVRLLIQNGAEVDSLDIHKSTPLSEAVLGGHLDVVRVLLAFGARRDIIDKNGKTALHIATEGRQEIFKYLLEYPFADTRPFKDPDVFCAFKTCPIKSKESLDILSKHISKMVFSGLKFNFREITYSWFKSKPFKDPGVEVFHEALDMKSKCIGATEITYRDFILKDPHQIMCYLRNESFVRGLQSGSHAMDFPNFKEIIDYQLCKGRQRKELMECSPTIARNLFRDFGSLAIELVEIILSYLSDRDILVLANICAGTKVS